MSGRVKKPGVILAPAGITARELIERAGGIEDGQTFKAYLPGGASGGPSDAAGIDEEIDAFASLPYAQQQGLEFEFYDALARRGIVSVSSASPLQVGDEKPLE